LAHTYSTKSTGSNFPPTPILSRYPALQSYFMANTPTNQITIASTAKSFLVSHYKRRSVPCEIEDVIKKHPLRYAMYNVQSSEWLPSAFPYIDIRNHCTPMFRRSPYTSLEWTLSATTHTPNMVIASQSKCPVEISYHEWDAFGHLRSGVRLQWRNIMLNLVLGTLTLADPVVYLLFRQAAWQAESPSKAEDPYREAHFDMAEEHFGNEVLTVLGTRLAIVSDNWQEGWTATILSLVACRLLSLAKSSDIRGRAFVFLKGLRYVVWKWIGHVSKLLKKAATGDQSGLRDRILQLATTCRSTYAIALDSSSLFQNPKDISIFIGCAIVLQQHRPGNLRALPEPLRYLLERDILLSADLLDDLIEAIRHNEAGLDDAIHDVWEGFKRDAPRRWESINDRWVVCITSAHDADRQARFVHLNLFDGTLLVDGKTLGHLPREILEHSFFSTLFPSQVQILWL
jgi:hypothetical protein